MGYRKYYNSLPGGFFPAGGGGGVEVCGEPL